MTRRRSSLISSAGNGMPEGGVRGGDAAAWVHVGPFGRDVRLPDLSGRQRYAGSVCLGAGQASAFKATVGTQAALLVFGQCREASRASRRPAIPRHGSEL